MKKYNVALSIAGSDPSGGAGLQADLKTFSACGCYGATAVVAVVDENTQGVTGVFPVPALFVRGQIKSVLDDIGADAVKIGMLHSSELIVTVKETLAEYNIRNIVLDPVMVATSGDPLLEPDAVDTLKNVLVPYARVITPNIPEAEILLGEKITSQAELTECVGAAQGGASVRRRACRCVLQCGVRQYCFIEVQTDRYGQHPRHRLYAFLGGCRLPGTRVRS